MFRYKMIIIIILIKYNIRMLAEVVLKQIEDSANNFPLCFSIICTSSLINRIDFDSG